LTERLSFLTIGDAACALTTHSFSPKRAHKARPKLNNEVFRGSCMTMDEDIAHVARVMAPSLRAFRGEPVLQPAYWRKRLQRIQDAFPLTQLQTFQIERLLGELDRFEAERCRGI
jgi:hypothetical protein